MNAYNTDALTQALAFFTAQAYKVNAKVYSTIYPDWDFARLIYTDTSGPEWSPGVLTYMTDLTGRANWQSGAAKDVPLADVSQDYRLKTFHLASIGYQYNYEEINTLIQMGGQLPERRASAAKLAYNQFMYNLALFGDTEKGLGGITNYPGVPIVVLPNDGTGGVRHWVGNDGIGLKTPQQIVRDINLLLTGVARSTFDTILADTIFLPQNALDYISSTPYNSMTMETILSFIMRTNLYTMRTGRQLTIRAFRELESAGTDTTSPTSAGGGRIVAYHNSPEYMKLHLPMQHKFLPVYQDGPLNWIVPGIFRTGGVEIMSTAAVRYGDGVTPPPVG